MEFVQCNVTVLCFRNFTSYVCFKPAISLHKYPFICIKDGIKHFYSKHSNSLTSTFNSTNNNILITINDFFIVL